MQIGDRKGCMHIVVLIIAILIGISALLFYRSQGVSLTGNQLRVPPALISGALSSSTRR